MPGEKRLRTSKKNVLNKGKGKVKLKIYGEEVVEKVVKLSGSSGRLYLPADWVGHSVKIVRLD